MAQIMVHPKILENTDLGKVSQAHTRRLQPKGREKRGKEEPQVSKEDWEWVAGSPSRLSLGLSEEQSTKQEVSPS